MTSFSVDTAAAALLEARRTRRPIPPPLPGPPDAAAAYAVQAATARLIGPTGGWKVGRASPDTPHSRAPIAADAIRPSPCRWPAAELLRIGLEVEIAVRFARDLEAPAPDRAAVEAAIGSVHAAIEVVDTRFDTWPLADPLWALADNQNNGGLVVAEPGRPYRPGEDLSEAAVRLLVDGEAVFDATGRNTGGAPIDMLVWLAAHLAEAGEPLRAGTVVTTGSLSGMIWSKPGVQVRAEIAGFPPVEVSFPA